MGEQRHGWIDGIVDRLVERGILDLVVERIVQRMLDGAGLHRTAPPPVPHDVEVAPVQVPGEGVREEAPDLGGAEAQVADGHPRAAEGAPREEAGDAPGQEEDGWRTTEEEALPETPFEARFLRGGTVLEWRHADRTSFVTVPDPHSGRTVTYLEAAELLGVTVERVRSLVYNRELVGGAGTVDFWSLEEYRSSRDGDDGDEEDGDDDPDGPDDQSPPVTPPVTAPFGGRTHTEGTRQRISESVARHRAEHPREVTDESRRRMSEAATGRESPRGFAGRRHTEETRARIAEANRARGPMSEETKRKIAESSRMRPPMSEETRRKIGEARRNRAQKQVER